MSISPSSSVDGDQLLVAWPSDDDDSSLENEALPDQPIILPPERRRSWTSQVMEHLASERVENDNERVENDNDSPLHDIEEGSACHDDAATAYSSNQQDEMNDVAAVSQEELSRLHHNSTNDTEDAPVDDLAEAFPNELVQRRFSVASEAPQVDNTDVHHDDIPTNENVQHGGIPANEYTCPNQTASENVALHKTTNENLLLLSELTQTPSQESRVALEQSMTSPQPSIVDDKTTNDNLLLLPELTETPTQVSRVALEQSMTTPQPSIVDDTDKAMSDDAQEAFLFPDYVESCPIVTTFPDQEEMVEHDEMCIVELSGPVCNTMIEHAPKPQQNLKRMWNTTRERFGARIVGWQQENVSTTQDGNANNNFVEEHGIKRRKTWNTVRERLQNAWFERLAEVAPENRTATKSDEFCNTNTNERVATRTKIACGVIVFVIALVAILLVAFLGFDKQTEIPLAENPTPPSPAPPAPPPSIVPSDQYNLLMRVLVNQGVLNLSSLGTEPPTPQSLALNWLAGTNRAQLVTDAYSDIDDWTSHDVLRPIVEQYTLAVLYYATKGWNWKENTAWLASKSDENPCHYYGVTCSNLTVWARAHHRFHELLVVSAIDLEDNDLVGNLPTEIRLLRNVESLNLGANHITGFVPEYLGTLTSLTNLDLSNNLLRGNLTVKAIQSWPTLKTLRLNGNALHGSIPSQVERLSYLQSLHLGSNGFSGSIPDTIMSLTNLVELELEHNVISGTIPSNIANLSNLKTLHLGDNHLSNEIPQYLFLLPMLEELRLEHNQLTSTIPEFSNSLSLQRLYLSNNELRGAIPASIANLLMLQEISLQDNFMTGTLPLALSFLEKLVDIRLAANRFTGTIPTTLGTLTHLETLFLEDNELRGMLPSEFEQLLNLSSLRIHYNDITGVVPCRLVDVGALQHASADCAGFQAPVVCECCTYCY